MNSVIVCVNSVETISHLEKHEYFPTHDSIALQFFQASFEAFIGVRDEEATAQLKLFGDNLQVRCYNQLTLDKNFIFFFKLYDIDILKNSATEGSGAKSPNGQCIQIRRCECCTYPCYPAYI